MSTANQETLPTVLITGFGLFRDHSLNTSWEAIRDGRLKLDREVRLLTKQIAVSYDEVDKVVAALWQDYKPILMVHIGLAAMESCIKVEQMARHGPYLHDDISKAAPHKHLRLYNTEQCLLEENTTTPKSYSCKPCSFGSTETCIDVDQVCDKVNALYDQGKLKLKTVKSHDAGLYLCEYIYYKSLCHSNRTVFVHVPDMEKYKLEDISCNLKYLVEALIDAVSEKQQQYGVETT